MNHSRLIENLLWISGVVMALVSLLLGLLALNEIKYNNPDMGKLLIKSVKFFAVGAVTMIGLAAYLLFGLEVYL